MKTKNLRSKDVLSGESQGGMVTDREDHHVCLMFSNQLWTMADSVDGLAQRGYLPHEIASEVVLHLSRAERILKNHFHEEESERKTKT